MENAYTEIVIPEPLESLLASLQYCSWECCDYDSFDTSPEGVREWMEVRGADALNTANQQVLELIEAFWRTEGRAFHASTRVALDSLDWVIWLKEWQSAIELAPSTPLPAPPPETPPIQQPPRPSSRIGDFCTRYITEILGLIILVMLTTIYWKLGWFPLQHVGEGVKNR